jgi:hypothetical protein
MRPLRELYGSKVAHQKPRSVTGPQRQARDLKLPDPYIRDDCKALRLRTTTLPAADYTTGRALAAMSSKVHVLYAQIPEMPTTRRN